MDLFEGMLRGAARIKLRGGIVGKVATLVMVACLAIAVVAVSAGVKYISYAAIGVIFLLVLIFGWRLINFGHSNPAAALLEGAEFLRHEELTLGMKRQTGYERWYKCGRGADPSGCGGYRLTA